MNGELYQLSRLVLCVKEAMRSGKEIEYKTVSYENSPVFTFAPRKGVLFNRAKKCGDVPGWYSVLKKRGLKRINLIIFFEQNNIKLAGFSNSAKQGIVTEYSDGKTTFWTAEWKFDSQKKAWSVYYKEFDYAEKPALTCTFADCRDKFEKTLLDIENLALTLEFEGFAKIFREAYGILTSEIEPFVPESKESAVPELPPEQLSLFLAASKADVFGAMGSWNDSPSATAEEMGLQEEYERLSGDLYVSIKKAVMNAVNGYIG